MSCSTSKCPLNANRWAGSGYVKGENTTAKTEADERIAQMMAARASQDTKYFPTAATTVATIATAVKPSCNDEICLRR